MYISFIINTTSNEKGIPGIGRMKKGENEKGIIVELGL